MSSSAICSHFTQNAWKKDLCSNCFKSKDEHKATMAAVKKAKTPVNTDYPNKYKKPAKSSIKSTTRVGGGGGSGSLQKKKLQSVSFPKELDKVIGYGGEWPSDDSDDDDDGFANFDNERDDDIIITETDDEATLELNRITRANTDFNTNNGNLLGDAEENIKKTFTALKLGAPQVDKEGKKQTLKISVVPFGGPACSTTKAPEIKAKLEPKNVQKPPAAKLEEQPKVTAAPRSSKPSAANSKIQQTDGASSPPLEMTMSKSLLDEISETLERKQLEQSQKLAAAAENMEKQTPTVEQQMENKPFLEIKKPIARNAPITKDHAKPKVQISQKYGSDTESISSDMENGVSAYYDVVESESGAELQPSKQLVESTTKKQTFLASSSQYIAEVLFSSKTRGASYNLQEGKMTADGLIVNKCASPDDALDSTTGSSFDGSSDEENTYNMIRSESDSGIGINIGTEYKPQGTAAVTAANAANKKTNLSAGPNSSDYEDIQIAKQQKSKLTSFDLEKSRELHGEPDGSADPDPAQATTEGGTTFVEPGKMKELPALPKSPPPTGATTAAGSAANCDARSSFLHGKKPELPAKPQQMTAGTSPLKTFAPKRPTPSDIQIQMSIAKSIAEFEAKRKQEKLAAAAPPTAPAEPQPPASGTNASELVKINTDTSATSAVASNSIYTRKPQQAANTQSAASTATASPPVIREKDKRERAVLNPKFRSLNTFVMQRANAAKNLQLQNAGSVMNLKQPLTPEPRPKNSRNLSTSEECLAGAKSKPKSKFSIKKFLRMGSSSSKAVEHLHTKKESVYTEICTGDDLGVAGKPRLVIIHPIDINPTAVEVVKDIPKSGDTPPVPSPSAHTKPPAPPVRNMDTRLELNKPARPPPPKSAELRRKQKIELAAMLSTGSVESASIGSGSIKSKSDNVYANLGEIRSAIAPRKPERTASMREREAQLEQARKRYMGGGLQRVDSATLNDTTSICSTNSEKSNTNPNREQACEEKKSAAVSDAKAHSQPNTVERKHNELSRAITSKLELFEQRAESSRSGSLKDSVRKINCTIDSYLKDKRELETMYDFVKSQVSRTDGESAASTPNGTQQRLAMHNGKRNNAQFSDTASVVSCTRSEYGSAAARVYGLNHSFVNLPRLLSASYAGSEIGDTEIYAPYSYYGSETGGDSSADINDSVWGTPTANKNRLKATNRLRMRKGRSVVHKNIEDNYTAVVVANHEALAQVLEQLQQTPAISPALRPLANAMNLRYEDFTIIDGTQPFVVGKKAFHAAVWTNCPVTLALSADCNQLSGIGGELTQLTGGVCDVLNPITEYCDLVPAYQLPDPSACKSDKELALQQATISVLPRLQLDSLQSIGAILKSKSQLLDKSNLNFRGSIPNLSIGGGLKSAESTVALRNVVSVQNLSVLNEEHMDSLVLVTPPAYDDVMTREVAFIMLQLINGMKNLQSKAIEEMPLSLSNVVLAKDSDNKDAQARLCVLQGNNNNNNDDDEPMGTLCKCAHIALNEILPATKISSLLGDILQQERAESLSKVKAVLEFVLWGPSDVSLSGSTKERELALQRWLDLERATVLHGLVRTRVELTVYDECHLMFLVRSTAKQMNDAAKIVNSYQQSTPTNLSTTNE